ncbi:hypothetical protein EJ06DRAFT_551086 [Trichodelitschia bisporula]|uniref:G-patch domain-containing protein n=1 Tax=Trichodelitschia bisporula TaxID=703511 RepID=A0A6G1HP37_9PEZI|nr:hypothetical protein EJ06DRAFT_551086 [Trichodelitschia bisporula]
MADEEDDYMTMAIAEPSKPVKETSIQRTARLKREAELRSRQKTKEERAAEAEAATQAALETELDTSNKGFKLLSKLGYKPGTALGKTPGARTQPIEVSKKENRGGIGLDTEKKRKFREEMEEQVKRVKQDVVSYRDRVRMEREEKRLEGQLIGAQKVAEQLDTADDETGLGLLAPGEKGHKKLAPLKSINVLWRGLVKYRLERENEKRMREAMLQRTSDLTSDLPTYDDSDEDADDRQALGKDEKPEADFVDDLDEEDTELDEFNALDPAEKVEKLVMYLRDKHLYCFWCKHQYADAEMDGCPGLTEDDHD